MAWIAVACLLVAVAGVAVAFGVRGSRRRQVEEAHRHPRDAHGWVRVLSGEEELRDAAERALWFERTIASGVGSRIERYEQLGKPEEEEESGAHEDIARFPRRPLASEPDTRPEAS
jgi:hypothetical protein